MPKVLITSGSTRIAYALCQNLAAHGYEVYIGDRQSITMAGMSRHCKGRMVYASPFTQQEAFIQDLTHFIISHGIDILMPVLEESYTCIKHEDTLKKSGVRFVLPSYEQVLQIHSKGSLTALAQELGLDVPPTWELSQVLQDAQLSKELPYPIMLKPKQGGGGWGMQPCANVAELLDAVAEHVEHVDNYMVQALVQGQLIGACGLYYKGQYIASDTYALTSAYPLRVGQSTTRISEPYPKAEESLQKILAHLQWHGLCQMDFIYDAAHDKSYLIDANPRFWGSITHNIAAGIEYPFYYALLAQEKTYFQAPKARMGTRSRWLGGDILRILAEFGEAKHKIQHVRQALANPVHYAANDDWNWRDPLPFITWGINLVLSKILHRKKDALPGIWE